MRIRAPYVSRAPAFRILRYLLTLPVALFRLWRLIVLYRITVVDGQFPSLQLTNFALLALLGLYRGKLLLTFQGRDIHTVIAARGFERRLWRWLLGRADAIVFCSDGLARHLKEVDPALRSVTVRNSVSIDNLIAERQSAVAVRLPPGPFILNVAAFEHKKGQDVLLRAFSRLAPDFPDLHLFLVGQRGPAYEELRSLVGALGLEQRVDCAYRNVPTRRYSPISKRQPFFALPSRAEGLPIALLERVCSGCRRWPAG